MFVVKLKLCGQMMLAFDVNSFGKVGKNCILAFLSWLSTTLLNIVVDVFWGLWDCHSSVNCGWGKQGHAPCRSSCCCGRHLAKCFGWVAPTYLKKADVTPHLVAHKHSLKYDRRPD